MNRARERAVVNGLCQRHGITRDVCPQYPLFLEALLTECIDEIIRGRMEDGETTLPQSISALKRAGWTIDRSVWASVEQSVKRNGIAASVLEQAARAWVLKGWRKGNVDGLIDWIVNGGAEIARPTSKSNAPRELSNNPAEW